MFTKTKIIHSQHKTMTEKSIEEHNKEITRLEAQIVNVKQSEESLKARLDEVRAMYEIAVNRMKVHEDALQRFDNDIAVMKKVIALEEKWTGTNFCSLTLQQKKYLVDWDESSGQCFNYSAKFDYINRKCFGVIRVLEAISISDLIAIRPYIDSYKLYDLYVYNLEDNKNHYREKITLWKLVRKKEHEKILFSKKYNDATLKKLREKRQRDE